MCSEWTIKCVPEIKGASALALNISSAPEFLCQMNETPECAQTPGQDCVGNIGWDIVFCALVLLESSGMHCSQQVSSLLLQQQLPLY